MGSLFRSVGMAVWAWRSTVPCFKRAAIWIPFLVIAFSQVLALLALMAFHNPVLSPVVTPVVTGLAGDDATHYPMFFMALPYVFSRVALVLSVVLTSLAVGAATLSFAGIFRGQEARGVWSTAGKHYPALVTFSAILVGIIYLVTLVPEALPTRFVQGSPLFRLGLQGALLVTIAVIQTFLAYGTAWIVLRGASALGAFRDSIRFSAGTFIATFLVLLLPLLLVFAIDLAAGQGDWIAEKFRPETVVLILGIKIVAEILISILLVGSFTRIFLFRTEEA